MIRPLILPCASPTAFGMFPLEVSTEGFDAVGASYGSLVSRERNLMLCLEPGVWRREPTYSTFDH
jgi:hypothetical protein